MARRLRYFEKKRGNRRTGSSKLGFAWEALFFAALLAVGCVSLWIIAVRLVLPEWQTRGFVEHRCTVLRKQIGEYQGGDGTTYRPEIQITYEVEGTSYTTETYDVSWRYTPGKEHARAILDRFELGKEYPCWYDPADPRVCVLVRGDNPWVWLLLVIPVSFLVIGGFGLLWRVFHWGKSAERRAAMVQRVQPEELFGTNGHRPPRLPGVPDGSNITNSPGTKLSYRLPVDVSAAWGLFGWALACAFWNGIVWVFLVIAVRGHLEGRPDWWLTLFLLPFLLVGAVLIGVLVRRMLVTTGIAPTRVEISQHPLRPGQSCKLLVSQPGRLEVNAISVRLVCEEEATYTQGTDTRRESREVYDRELYRREGFTVDRGRPFEAECHLSVPDEAMHSLRTPHNAVQWKVVVEGDVSGWPEYRRAFPLVVWPAAGRDGA